MIDSLIGAAIHMADQDTATRTRAREAADKLTGTAQGLSDVASEEDQQNSVFCAALDDQVFCCETCNWWCEVSEMSAEQNMVCAECAPPGAEE